MDVGIAVASWLSLFICSLLVMNIARVQSDRLVDISFLESAISKGAGSISPSLFFGYPQSLISQAVEVEVEVDVYMG